MKLQEMTTHTGIEQRGCVLKTSGDVEESVLDSVE